jgi:hypothetical protein
MHLLVRSSAQAQMYLGVVHIFSARAAQGIAECEPVANAKFCSVETPLSANHTGSKMRPPGSMGGLSYYRALQTFVFGTANVIWINGPSPGEKLEGRATRSAGQIAQLHYLDHTPYGRKKGALEWD